MKIQAGWLCPALTPAFKHSEQFVAVTSIDERWARLWFSFFYHSSGSIFS